MFLSKARFIMNQICYTKIYQTEMRLLLSTCNLYYYTHVYKVYNQASFRIDATFNNSHHSHYYYSNNQIFHAHVYCSFYNQNLPIPQNICNKTYFITVRHLLFVNRLKALLCNIMFTIWIRFNLSLYTIEPHVSR